MNKYQRMLLWILGPFAGLFIVLAVVAALTDFVPWLPPTVAAILVLVGGAVVWLNLAKVPDQKS